MNKIKDFDAIPVVYNQLEDPGIYKEFIRFACRYADTVCLTCDGWNDEIEEFADTKWGFLKDSIIAYEYTNQTPVTKGPHVILLYFRIDHVMYRWLYEKRDVYDFMDPMENGKDFQSLWDLCFVKDRQIVMSSCSHEKFCHVDEKMLRAFEKV